MRKDLNKQLCEHERSGSEISFRNVRHAKKYKIRDPEGEDALHRESIKFRHVRSGNTKSFSENLSPLKGQVRRAIGRPWSKFYSELCEVFDKRSVINQHILQHLEDYICTNVRIHDDGSLWVHRYGGTEPLADSMVQVFVDPRDGIIKKNKTYKPYRSYNKELKLRREAEEAAKYREIDRNNVLHLIDGVWYHFVIMTAPYGRYVDTVDETFGWKVRTFKGQNVYDWLKCQHVYSEDGKPPIRYHAVKRTASKKILKKAGLRS